jgi:hypothetical protein
MLADLPWLRGKAGEAGSDLRASAGCISNPPNDWVLTKARWGGRGQRDQGLSEPLQAWPCAREACMVAVHDPEVIRRGSGDQSPCPAAHYQRRDRPGARQPAVHRQLSRLTR